MRVMWLKSIDELVYLFYSLINKQMISADYEKINSIINELFLDKDGKVLDVGVEYVHECILGFIREGRF